MGLAGPFHPDPYAPGQGSDAQGPHRHRCLAVDIGLVPPINTILNPAMTSDLEDIR